jgi:hypothetical protein
MQTVAVVIGLPQQPSFVSVSTCELRHVLLAVPRRFSPPGSFSHEPNRPLQSRFSQPSASCFHRANRRPQVEDLKPTISTPLKTTGASWGFRVPSSRHQPVVSTCRAEHPTPRYVPSSAFHPPSTVCSTTCLVGLFRPTTTFRVLPSGIWPHRRAVPGLPRSLPSCRFLHRACLSEDGSSTVTPASGLCSLR